MSYTITLPAVGESITEGVVARWLVADGAYVASGAPLYELETDKISSEVQAEVGGIVRHRVAEGATVAVGAVVAEIEEGEAPAKAGSAAPTQASAPAAKAADSSSDNKPLSPAARAVAAEHGIDASALSGSGKDGRVTKGDVLAAVEAQPAAPAAAAPAPAPAPKPAAAPAPAPALGGSRQKMSPLRKRIAQRLVQAQRTAAILSTFNEVDLSTAMALRKRYKERFQEVHGVGLGFMSIFAKAVCEALQAFPLVNAQIDGDDIVKPDGVHLGIAVGTEKGLVVPVIRNAHELSFAGIELAIKAYAAKAKSGKLALADLEGGSFTISNGGVYGSLLSTPILNPPQSGILGMHAIKERPVAIDGQVVIRPMMYLALSYDHRIVDGSEAVGFLVRVKDLVEAPERMLLGI